MNLFLDIDGVLLGKNNSSSPVVSLAFCAEDFINYVIKHFECYWLTIHCKGKTSSVLDYLSPYTTQHILEKLSNFKPTEFDTLKTEALFGDFIWIDDGPLAYEIRELNKRNQIHRWLEVNTYKRPYDLCHCLVNLKNRISNNSLFSP